MTAILEAGERNPSRKRAAAFVKEPALIAFSALCAHFSRDRVAARARAFAALAVPPAITLAILLIVWQIGFGKPGASLDRKSTRLNSSH